MSYIRLEISIARFLLVLQLYCLSCTSTLRLWPPKHCRNVPGVQDDMARPTLSPCRKAQSLKCWYATLIHSAPTRASSMYTYTHCALPAQSSTLLLPFACFWIHVLLARSAKSPLHTSVLGKWWQVDGCVLQSGQWNARGVMARPLVKGFKEYWDFCT